MYQSKIPLWKKSILQFLSLWDITDWLNEIMDNGDMYGYERSEENESGYYQEYKELFEDLAGGAYQLWEALQDSTIKDNWDNMTVALLGKTHTVLGFDQVQTDYFHLVNRYEEDCAVEEAITRIKRLKKDDLIRCFQKILTVLLLFFDVKASHDCLTAIVEELDERGALLQQKNAEIDRLYEELTAATGSEHFDEVIQMMPPQMWVE